MNLNEIKEKIEHCGKVDSTVYNELRKRCKDGDTDAMVYFGDLYAKEILTCSNKNKYVLYCYNEAYGHGNKEAQERLGKIYFEGSFGVKRNLYEAAKYGNVNAEIKLINILFNDATLKSKLKAVELFERNFDKIQEKDEYIELSKWIFSNIDAKYLKPNADSEMIFDLAKRYYFGINGRVQNYKYFSFFFRYLTQEQKDTFKIKKEENTKVLYENYQYEEDSFAFETDIADVNISNEGKLEKGIINNFTFDEKMNAEEKDNLLVCREKIDSIINEIKNSKFEVDNNVAWNDENYYSNLFHKERNQKKDEDIIDLEQKKIEPYYRRLKMKKQNGNEVDIYIGYKTILDQNKKALVYAWTNPNTFSIDYDNGTAEFMNEKVVVELQRNIIIAGDDVSVYEVYGKNGNMVFNKPKSDEYLKNIWKQKKDEKYVSDIVATLQNEQNLIISKKIKENFIVQGCAGSGKSMVLFHRLKYLLDNNFIDSDEICAITPSKSFNDFIRPLLSNFEIEKINLFSKKEFYDYILDCYLQGNSEYNKNRWSGLYVGNYTILSHYGANKVTFYPNITIKYGEPIEYREDKELDEKVVNFFYSNEFFKLISNQEKIKVNPLTPSKLKRDSNGKIDIIRSLIPKKMLDLFPKYDIKPGIIHLCELYALCVIYMYRCGKYIYTAKQSNIDYVKRLDFDFYCLDEAQDYPIGFYKLLNGIGKIGGENKVYNLFGDINQSIYNYSLHDWKDIEGYIGDGKIYEFKKNYRNSMQITEYINKECSTNMDTIGVSDEKIIESSILKIDEFIEKFENYNIAIICSEKCLNLLKEKIPKYIKYIRTVEETKGLEYYAAFVITKDMTNNEKYIALSRPLSVLYVSKTL